MVRWMMEKWGTMAVKEGHVERERWEARNKKKKKKRQAEADWREMGRETVSVTTHLLHTTHKYFELIRGALMKLSR